jgi:hypothetical protein
MKLIGMLDSPCVRRVADGGVLMDSSLILWWPRLR